MIPFLTYKRAVDRFSRAAQMRIVFEGKSEQDAKKWEFEYRDAKRALYDLGKLLITGEVPNKGMK